MKSISRRSVTTGLAAAVTAIPAVGLSQPARVDSGEDAAMRRLWQNYIEAEIKFGDALSACCKSEA
jgi:hypothetical protein